jgi:choice-of-anchor C domain-containing protein
MAAFTGLTNEGFEDLNSTYFDDGSGFQQLNAPNASIEGWTVDAGSVDWIGEYWLAPEGAMSIDMSGVGPGTLSQTFDTTIGNTYTVSFLLSGNPVGEPAIKTLDVSATGGTVGNYSHDTTGTDLTTMVWTSETYEFLSTTATAFGPAIDNVVVTEFVPSKDDCKNGGWQTMIDTAGNSFKNQGDCVSFFATKGKNLGAVAPAIVPTAVGASSNDAASSVTKHSNKEKATVTGRHTTERHAPKVKSKSQKTHNTHKTK